MAPLRPFLILALLAWISLADQGMWVIGGHLGQCRVGRLPGLSCKDWCSLPQSHARAAARKGFVATRKCQCDELCSYYQSCCADYVEQCKPKGLFRALWVGMGSPVRLETHCCPLCLQ